MRKHHYLMQVLIIQVSVPTELQYYRLCDLINGLPQIQWFVYQVETTGDYLYIRARSIQFTKSTLLFIINPEGDLLQ